MRLYRSSTVVEILGFEVRGWELSEVAEKGGGDLPIYISYKALPLIFYWKVSYIGIYV